jgi:hypothetical protein
VFRRIRPDRPGRWEIRVPTGKVVGVVAESPPIPSHPGPTFTVAHHPIRTPPYAQGRARGSWTSDGHPSVPAAVAALMRYLTEGDER